MVAQMNQSILTLILLVPLAGALVVALLPDRGKLPTLDCAAHDAGHVCASRCICRRILLRARRVSI